MKNAIGAVNLDIKQNFVRVLNKTRNHHQVVILILHQLVGTLKIAVVLVMVFNLREAPRIILKLEIEGSRVDMLYDSGSTYSIITQNTYDSLKYKLPLTPVNKSGITISQERFEIQGVAFVNIKFK